jgi:hypothetical protein
MAAWQMRRPQGPPYSSAEADATVYLLFSSTAPGSYRWPRPLPHLVARPSLWRAPTAPRFTAPIGAAPLNRGVPQARVRGAAKSPDLGDLWRLQPSTCAPSRAWDSEARSPLPSRVRARFWVRLCVHKKSIPHRRTSFAGGPGPIGPACSGILRRELRRTSLPRTSVNKTKRRAGDSIPALPPVRGTALPVQLAPYGPVGERVVVDVDVVAGGMLPQS